MAAADPAALAERVAAVQRHLRRVADQLPVDPGELRPETAASDAVVLHLWQAVQVTIRNLIVHAYADLDLRRVHDAARTGPPDLLAFAEALVRHEGLA
ncbi:MAG: HepT-like ribonuclease domain-containing protein [Kineosporiaceae bacterium]